MKKLAPIRVNGTLGWMEFEGERQWTFGTAEGIVWPLKYANDEIDLAGNVGKPFILHGRYFAGILTAERLEAV